MSDSFESKVFPHTQKIESKLLQYYSSLFILCFIVRFGVLFFTFYSFCVFNSVCHSMYNHIQSAHRRALI